MAAILACGCGKAAHKLANQRKHARAAARQRGRTMKILKKIAIFCLLTVATTSVADSRFL